LEWGQDSSGRCFSRGLAIWLFLTQNLKTGGIPKGGWINKNLFRKTERRFVKK
jgi:hypothetical protein